MREMLKSGLIEFGGYTRNYCDLLVVNKDVAFNEIKECKEILEKELNRQILSVSYPFGRFNESHKIILQDIGYKYGMDQPTFVKNLITLEELKFMIRLI